MKLELLDKLADDNLAEIHMGRLWGPTGPRLVTVRRLYRQVASSPGLADELRRASERVRGIEHPCILPHIGFFEVDGDHLWVTARTLGFDVEQVMVRLASREVRITPLRTLQLGLDLLEGLKALHAQDEIFVGLGPRQVLVGFDGLARLDALGFEAATLANKDLKQKARRARTSTLAPEVVQGRIAQTASDVFSAAALLYMLLTGRSPLGEKQRGGGMSTRHVAVKPPSKLERSLPYACDAVFIKALAVAPSGRHGDAAALASAVESLRRSLVQGSDEGRAGVKDFIENLFPNEASVVGMPGSLERPASSASIELGDAPNWPVATPGLAQTSSAFSDKVPTVQHSADEDTKTKTVKAPAPVSAPGAGSSVEDDAHWTYEGEEQAVAQRLAGGEAGTQPGQPPAEPSRRDAISASVGQSQATAPAGRPTRREMPALADLAEEESQAGDTAENPAVVVEDGLVEDFFPRRDTEVMPAVEVSQPPAAELPLWRRPSSLLAMGILAAIVLFVILFLFGSLDSSPEVTLAGPPSDATSFIGFLSVEGLDGAHVILDGELLPGATPLSSVVVKAGKRRMRVKSADGKLLLDRMVLIKVGKHQTLDLQKIEADPGPVAPASATPPAEPPPEPPPEPGPAEPGDTMQEVDAILAKPPADERAVKKVVKKRRRTKRTRRVRARVRKTR